LKAESGVLKAESGVLRAENGKKKHGQISF
jgi:hypothetical protein